MQNILMHMWIVSWGQQKSFLYACKSLYFLFIFYFRDSVCYFKKINENKIKYLQMTVLYTKYKAENNAVWTIYVKYGQKNLPRGLEIWVWNPV